MKEKRFITSTPGGLEETLGRGNGQEDPRGRPDSAFKRQGDQGECQGKSDVQVGAKCPALNQGILKGGSITVLLTSCLTGLESAV
jgi:hypothetical protein